jgi:shikimate kinase
MTGPIVVLVGAPGAGKTTVGTLLAKRLSVPFRDTDADIVAVAGKPVGDIFLDDGEDAFRALERDAVRAALTEHEGVLALGGGAILAEETRDLLRDKEFPVIHLVVGISDAVERVGLGRSRPVLALNPRGSLLKLLQARTPLYEDVATAAVSTDGRPVEDVTSDVEKLVRS